MLEKITENLSNTYYNWKTRALALGAATLLFLPACASLNSIFYPSKETCPPQIAPAEPGVSHVTPSEPSAGPSPEPPETPPSNSAYGTEGYEDKIYYSLFSAIEKNGIDLFTDQLISDFKEVGEHGGSIILTEEGLKVFEGTDNSIIAKYLEPIKRLRAGEDTKEDRESLAEFVLKYRSVSERNVAAFLKDRLPKASAAEKKTIADIMEQYLDSFCNIIVKNRAQVAYHFHPVPDGLSEEDINSASGASVLPVAFAYFPGKLVAFYYKDGRHNRREFEIKDVGRLFELDLLSSKNYIKTAGRVFYNENGRMCSISLDQAREGLINLLFAIKSAGNLAEYRKKVAGVIDFAYRTFNQRLEYLNSVRSEFGNNPSFSETEEHYRLLISQLDYMVDKFKYKDEIKKCMPKPEQEMPSAERPLGWKDYLGLGVFSFLGCAGVYLAVSGARGLMRRFFGSNKTNDAGQGQ